MDSAPTFKPGIYTDMPFDEYLAVDAFSASCVGPLLESFPARLKDPKPDTRPFKMGRTFHACVLEGQMPGLLHYIVADNFRYIKPDTRAKSKSEHALASAELDESGLTPMKESEADAIIEARDALLADPAIKGAFSNGRPEVSAFWIDPQFDIPCKCRFDWLPNKGRILPDAKFVASIDEPELRRHIANYRVVHRSIHYEDGARIAAAIEDPIYCPVWIEKKPPYWRALRPVEDMDKNLVQAELDRAKSIWAHCWRSDHWPGPEHNTPIELPGWERRRLEIEYELDRHVKAGEPLDEAA